MTRASKKLRQSRRNSEEQLIAEAHARGDHVYVNETDEGDKYTIVENIENEKVKIEPDIDEIHSEIFTELCKYISGLHGVPFLDANTRASCRSTFGVLKLEDCYEYNRTLRNPGTFTKMHYYCFFDALVKWESVWRVYLKYGYSLTLNHPDLDENPFSSYNDFCAWVLWNSSGILADC